MSTRHEISTCDAVLSIAVHLCVCVCVCVFVCGCVCVCVHVCVWMSTGHEIITQW